MPHAFTKQQLVAAINESLDVPFISEEIEAHLIERALGEIIDYIPPAFWPLLADASKGLSTDVMRRVVSAIAQIVIDALPMPWLPPSVKANLVSSVSNLIIERAQHGMALPGLMRILAAQ